MIIKIADAIDRFLFGSSVTVITMTQTPVKVRILKPGQPLGVVTNDFSPPNQ
jgi:hypothetical protein